MPKFIIKSYDYNEKGIIIYMNRFFEISRYMLRVLFFFLSDEVNPATSRVEGNLRLTWSRCALVQYTDDDDRQAAAKRRS